MGEKAKKANGAWASSRATAKKFLWHFHSPWGEKFQHVHWWKPGQGKQGVISSAWEVLRRHPKAMKLHKPDALPSNNFEAFICEHGMYSWPQIAVEFAKKNDLKLDSDGVAKLQEKFHQEWLEALADSPPQRGFDLRPVYSVTCQSTDIHSGINPNAALTLDPKLRKRARKDPHAASILVMAETVRESEIARLAIEHHRAGRVIIAIQPDVANLEHALDALSRCYKQHRSKTVCSKGLWGEWLQVIREFENDELNGKRSDQIAARYRRIIKGFKWSS